MEDKQSISMLLNNHELKLAQECWFEAWNECVYSIYKYYDLDNMDYDAKCIAALCVVRNAFQDIFIFLESCNKKTTAELCFLIRNLDVAISCLLDINKILFDVGTNKTEKAIRSFFENYECIIAFKELRSLVLAHPINTNREEYGTDKTVYLEDIRTFNKITDYFTLKERSDYVMTLSTPERSYSYHTPLNLKSEIFPVIDAIFIGVKNLTKRIEQKTKERFNEN